MAIIVQDRAVNLPSGTRQITAENVPDALTQLRLTLKRCTSVTPTFWPNTLTLLNLAALISINGGPFVQCARVTGAPGGVQVESSVEQPFWWWGFTLWPGVNRQIRFEIEVINGPLVSELGLEAR